MHITSAPDPQSHTFGPHRAPARLNALSTIIEAKWFIVHANQWLRMGSGSVRKCVFSRRMKTGGDYF